MKMETGRCDAPACQRTPESLAATRSRDDREVLSPRAFTREPGLPTQDFRLPASLLLFLATQPAVLCYPRPGKQRSGPPQTAFSDGRTKHMPLRTLTGVQLGMPHAEVVCSLNLVGAGVPTPSMTPVSPGCSFCSPLFLTSPPPCIVNSLFPSEQSRVLEGYCALGVCPLATWPAFQHPLHRIPLGVCARP